MPDAPIQKAIGPRKIDGCWLTSSSPGWKAEQCTEIKAHCEFDELFRLEQEPRLVTEQIVGERRYEEETKRSTGQF